MAAVDQLIRHLESASGSGVLANPYRDGNSTHDCEGAAAIRRENLARYLSALKAGPAPRMILVGEAAGYQGCRFSGIAFTSEHTLLNHGFFGEGYRRSSSRERPWKEPSGSIVWETSDQLGQPFVLWNIVPFHPHLMQEPLSNRTPTADERQQGLEYFLELQELFPDAAVIAVGKLSAERLDEAKVKNIAVRHPAYGGKKEFQDGVLAAAKP
jgi:uracil-DNA glycosylase